MTRELPTGRFVLLPAPSNTLCLAYANTLTWRGSETPSESLGSAEALFAWIAREARYPAEAMDEVRDWAGANPAQAAQLFAAAMTLRETIFRCFETVAADKRPSDADFDVLRAALDKCGGRSSLARQGEIYGWLVLAPAYAIEVLSTTAASEDRHDPWRLAAAGLLAPVLWSAADLLLDAGRRRIRQCANEKCLWLFVDESKSGTRRWCDMGSCGNRAKAQRHYAKVKRA